MPKSPVQKILPLIEKLDGNKKNQEEFQKSLIELKKAIIGTSDEVVKQLAKEINSNHLLYLMVLHMPSMDFESKKLAVQIFNRMVSFSVNETFPTVEYILNEKAEILTLLCNGYDDPACALNMGVMLRECIKQERLARVILYSDELFYPFFKHVQKSEFDVASDAFSSLKALLTCNKILCAEFLEKNYDKVFEHYRELLTSENYVTKRQSLKLLGELLLDRANFTVMTKYISNPENLKLMMQLLRNQSRNIQFEAFHVFKVFVANPNKTQPIIDILLKNKEKLIKFLTNFHNDRAEDEQFSEEKQYLIKQIKDIKS
eukprot:m.219586 g.219586  ORF g.219586 m.219586 type:complete len:316 (+) comp17003_c0_seq1:219-1166(+)